MSTTMFNAEVDGKPYLVVREQPPIGRPLTLVFSDKGEASKRTVRRIRKAIEAKNGA